MREIIVADLQGRDLSRFARAAASTSRSSAASLLRRASPERNVQLAQLVEYGAAPTIATLLAPQNVAQFDWEQRDVTGATLLMQALRDGTRAVVETLLDGPPGLFAGIDASGWNILHHVVSRGEPGFLRAMLTRHPLLAAYADLSGNQAGTPLRMAYTCREEAMFDLLLATPVARIDELVAQADDAMALAGVYPFTATGHPRPRAAEAAPPNAVVYREPTASRIELLKTMIADNEPIFTRLLLNRLEPEVLATAREEILHAVTREGSFAAARVVIDHLGEDAFAPLTNGATLCHLAAGRSEDDLLQWLLRKPAARALLFIADDDGRTPLQHAAAAGSASCFLALQPRYPDLALRDAYRHGALHLLFRADPLAAHAVLDDEATQARLTSADLTTTLQAALLKLLECNFEHSWCPNDGDTLEVNADFIESLLSLPPGRIDVHAPVGESGHSIITLLESGLLARILDRAVNEEQQDASMNVLGSFSHYENAALLARASAHLVPHGRAAAPPSVAGSASSAGPGPAAHPQPAPHLHPGPL